MSIEGAIRLEGLGDVGAAIEAYDVVIRRQGGTAAIANLMVLCWQSLDPGVMAAGNTHPDFARGLAGRLSELLAASMDEKYRWGEVDFWGRYIRWADYGEDLDLDECLRFMARGDGYIEPAFHVLAITRGGRMVEQCRLLLARYDGMGTARARYVSSVINSLLR